CVTNPINNGSASRVAALSPNLGPTCSAGGGAPLLGLALVSFVRRRRRRPESLGKNHSRACDCATLRAPAHALRPSPIISSVLALAIASSAAAQTQLYKRTVVPGKDICLAWNTRTVTYSPDAAGNSKTPGDDEFTAIDAAFGSWQALSDTCSDFKFVNGGRTTTIIVGKAPGSDTSNIVT